jgi:glucose/arabinose dehydrogenase
MPGPRRSIPSRRLALVLARTLAGATAMLLLACSGPAGRHSLPSAASTKSIAPVGTSGPGATAPLLVDDAAAANPDLIPATVAIPPGFTAAPHTVMLPPGFTISLLATGLATPRFMAFDPAGNLLVGSLSGNVYRFPAANGSIAPAAQAPSPLLSGLTAPHSVAFDAGYLYVGETGRVSRYPYGADGTLGPRETAVGDLPVRGEHFTRTVAFGPDGNLYLGIGSSCNICDEQDNRRAAISRYNADGTGGVRFAWGTRNPVGLAFQPGTGALWATVNERDNQGNEIPPDLVTIVRQGDNFGWPDCQPPSATPQAAGDTCDGITPPTIGIQAHSAPLGLAFSTGSQFPAGYQNDLFVVQHGSWNRQPPAPPQILQIHFQAGSPVGVRVFATGWQTDAGGARWGRPAGIIAAPDGSLIVSDDTSGFLYRISYSGG